MMRTSSVLFLFSLTTAFCAQGPPIEKTEALGTEPEYVVVDLGTLGTGPSEGRDINEAGEVVGFSETGETSPESNDVRRGFIWLPSPAHGLSAGLHDLGTLRSDPLGSSLGQGLSDRGAIVGYSETDDLTALLDPVNLGFLWQDGIMTPLPIPPGPSPSFMAGTAVNNDGEIALTLSLGFGCQGYLFLPQAAHGLDAGLHAVPALDRLNESSVADINGEGQVVGKSVGICDALGGPNSAFLWLQEPDLGLDAGIHDLTPGLPEGWEAQATAINEVGQVVGVISEEAQIRGFLWQQGVNSSLPFRAMDINDAGWIVGDSQAGPVLYRGGALEALADLIAPGSGWQLLEVKGINERGQIVGTGRLDGGERRAILLDRAARIFRDGFEAGTTEAWSAAISSP